MSTQHHQQKALFLQSKQGKFVVSPRDIPKPGNGEVLLKIHATALNPVDYKIQQHGIFVEKYPAILGADAAGVVEAIGDGVHTFVKGDRIFAHGLLENDKATFQQFNITVADFAAKIPATLSYEQAASIPLGFDTASTGLYGKSNGAGIIPPWEAEAKGLYAGKPIVILGGSSSVGSYAIQLARLSGFSPIITTASPQHKTYLQSLGATHILDRHLSPSELVDSGNKIIQLSKADLHVVYDAISIKETQQIGWELLSSERPGKLILTLPPVVEKKENDKREAISTYGSPHAPQNRELSKGAWKQLEVWVDNGEIQPNNIDVLPNGLEGIIGGLERLKQGEVSGTKLIAHPQETA
ncbi:hypothetical protein SERLA73DRAFT_181366 [Serpula lacrymans var. lacrymans S7.3]|uniref:Enoyl reductase (ER) domain-containing protein n=2 Tax=Serpula lacrymans var. lacrymans TaxID=341189 RepID=F8PXY0_SERL3|nr:uncharacterized protein SERLADRAFT_467476 [Serpula lacrymans var. lacrymans S7.9]EGN98743.1 hypothetical protein SERLA73DRAFT_181366 [Serpula lacrymans var. lacrymans S7.3]EGO24341.1 hypothetical protein SERLADRAFT_467476 [Serpula lacrymans var. lacrymans S7.9]